MIDVSAIRTLHGTLRLPAFLPDATRGSVRCVDAGDLAAAGIQAVMANSFHLAGHPGVRRIQRLGGLHRFMGWDGPIVTDSGGFQVLSLIRNNPAAGEIRANEVIFRDQNTGTKVTLTPERSIRAQLQLGSDIMIALDDCTGIETSAEEQKRSVERTVRWFQRSRAELERQRRQRTSRDHWPLLAGVAQGGTDPALRESCIRSLLDLGADAIGFGGWPIDAEGKLLTDMFALLMSLVPPSMPIFALGVGKPEHLAALAQLGRRFVFDCSLPTRDARRFRLYALEPHWEETILTSEMRFYRYVYLLDSQHAGSMEPIDCRCDCVCCQHYGRAFLHHLAKVKDTLAERLATIHNLRFYTRLIEHLASLTAPALHDVAL